MKKTKQEKRLADLRRQLYSFKETQTSLSATEVPVAFPTTKIAANEEKNPVFVPTAKTYKSESIYVYPIQLVRKDLTKTALLCILAISLELALYLLLERQIVLPLKF